MGKDEKCGLTECPPEWGKIIITEGYLEKLKFSFKIKALFLVGKAP